LLEAAAAKAAAKAIFSGSNGVDGVSQWLLSRPESNIGKTT